MISVVVLAYNPEPQVMRLIDEFYEQEDIEVIVANNGDPISFPNGVKVLNLGKNRGVDALNEAYHVARGEVIATFDQDMFIKRDDMRTLVEPIQRGECLLVAATVVRVDSCYPETRWRRGVLGGFYGGAFAVGRQVIDAGVRFDAEFFLYVHELDFLCQVYDKFGLAAAKYSTATTLRATREVDLRGKRRRVDYFTLRNRILFFRKHVRWTPKAVRNILVRSVVEACLRALIFANIDVFWLALRDGVTTRVSTHHYSSHVIDAILTTPNSTFSRGPLVAIWLDLLLPWMNHATSKANRKRGKPWQNC